MLITVCPEILGGLGIPRENSEIAGGDGTDVLTGDAAVITISGRDVTKNFVKGANAALSIAKKYRVRKAILKSKSPACGSGKIYDGTFCGRLKAGKGVLASLLIRNGIRVYTENGYKHA